MERLRDVHFQSGYLLNRNEWLVTRKFEIFANINKTITRLNMQTLSKCIFITLLLSAFFFTGCSSTTSVTSSWKDINYTAQPLTSILVIGLTGDPGAKFNWENIMAAKLRENGVKKAMTTLNAFPQSQDKEITTEEIINYVKNNNIQGVLVTRLVDIKTEKVYHPPTSMNYGPSYGYYNNFNNYYSHSYNMVSTPGYTSTATIYLLETNLYQVAGQKLVWSMASDTSNSGADGLNTMINSVSKKVVKTMKKDKLI
jgi:hypothetical protein